MRRRRRRQQLCCACWARQRRAGNASTRSFWGGKRGSGSSSRHGSTWNILDGAWAARGRNSCRLGSVRGGSHVGWRCLFLVFLLGKAPLSEHRAGSFAVAAQLSLPWLPYVFPGMFFHAPFAPFFLPRGDESPRSRFQSWVRSTVKTPLAVTGKWESARFWGVLENTRASLGSQELPWIPVGIPK